MHVEINQGRRLLEELCFCTRKEDIRDLIQLFIDMKIPFKSYSLSRLICLAVDGREKHNQDSICGLLKELDYHRTLFPEEEGFEKKDRCYPCLKALKKDMFFAAVEILKSGMGMLTA